MNDLQEAVVCDGSSAGSAGWRPRFAGHGDFAVHFDALRGLAASAEVVEHLLVHVEAALDAPGRLALFRALWAHWQPLDDLTRIRLTGFLDGRFATVLGWLATPFDDPRSVQVLAQAHVAPGVLHAPDFVLALYRHHGLDAALTLAGDLPSEVVWPRLRAELDLAGSAGLAPARARALHAACMALVEREAAQAGSAFAAMLEIAVLARDEAAALLILSECVRLGLHGGLPAGVVLRWLQDQGDAPLALTPSLQARWWQPAQLHRSGYRARLLGALATPGPHGRVAALSAALADLPTDAQASSDSADSAEAWAALAALSRCHAHPLPCDEALTLVASGLLADVSAAALCCRLGEAAAAAGDMVAAVTAWADARQLTGHAGAARCLQDWLLATAPDAVRQARATQPPADPEAPWFGSCWQDEEPLWEALACCGATPVENAARLMLARLYTEGCWVPTQQAKARRLDRAHALWQALRRDPAWQALAERRLASPQFTVLHRMHSSQGGRHHLWRETTGADAVMIVFSCVESHDGFASVPSLLQGLRGHHLLFLGNPELNWYGGSAFDDVCRVIEQRVAGRFAPWQVTCYFGSMGGYAALRFALHFGFRAIAFNPQVDLDLWAAYRPQQRALIHAEPARVHLQDLPAASFARSPIYCMVGASTPDRAGFSLLIDRVATCEQAHLIVEKFADPHHAGLIRRATGGRVPEALERIESRLTALGAIGSEPVATAGYAEVPMAQRLRFWRGVAAAARLKLEIVVRQGRVWVRESTDCGTLDL